MWLDQVRNNEDLLKHYNNIEYIQELKISSVSYEDGCYVRISFDLVNFPDNIPEKWIEKEYDSACMSINFISIIELNQNGWQAGQRVFLEIINDGKYKDVEITSENKLFSLKMKVQEICISSVSGYKKSTYP